MNRTIGRFVSGICVATLVGAAGCAGGAGNDNSRTAAKSTPPDSPLNAGGWTTARGGAVGGSDATATGGGTASPVGSSGLGSIASAAAPSAAPAIPAGAQWTIFCDSITAPDHVSQATALKEVLTRNSRAAGWYVIHQADRSSIYLGYYRDIDPKNAPDAAARADAQRAQRDKQLVESLPDPRDSSGKAKLFPRVQFTQLDAPDPDAPPQWNLTNAKGYWSVQIAAFTGPQRKQNAVEAVREARAMNVPAYYFHGPSSSSVCVGTWPAQALKRQDAAKAGTRDDDPNSVLLLNLTGQAMTDEQKRAIGNGSPVKEFVARVEILDPTLRKTLNDYPEHAIDGAVQMMRMTDKTNHTKLVPRPSFIVQIPQNGSQAYAGDAGPSSPSNSGASDDLNALLRRIGQ